MRRKTRLPKFFYPMNQEKQYYLHPEEALKFGLIDEIVPEKTAPHK